MLPNAPLVTLVHATFRLRRGPARSTPKVGPGAVGVHSRADSAGTRLRPRTRECAFGSGSRTGRTLRRRPKGSESPNAHPAVYATRGRPKLAHRGHPKFARSASPL